MGLNVDAKEFQIYFTDEILTVFSSWWKFQNMNFVEDVKRHI